MAHRLLLRLAAVAVLAAPLAARAADTGGCESFAWSLATELAWMKAAATEAPAASGTALPAPPDRAVTLTLAPQADVKLAVEPSRTPKNAPEKPYAGTLVIEALPAGLYQVTLSGQGWVDVVQSGATLASKEHTGKSDCDGVRKSVRFELADGPATIQLTSVPEAAITLAIRRAP